MPIAPKYREDLQSASATQNITDNKQITKTVAELSYYIIAQLPSSMLFEAVEEEKRKDKQKKKLERTRWSAKRYKK